MIKLGKDYVWEMSHRLPFHNGLCSNIHGHSYKMRVELVGELDANGMLIDFYDIDKIVLPIIKEFDHSIVINSSDTKVIDFMKDNNFRHKIIDFTSTSEHLAIHFADLFKAHLTNYPNIHILRVRIYETFDAFAEYEINLKY